MTPVRSPNYSSLPPWTPYYSLSQHNYTSFTQVNENVLSNEKMSFTNKKKKIKSLMQAIDCVNLFSPSTQTALTT